MRCALEMADGRKETVEADSLRDLLAGCMRKAEGIASEDNPIIFQVHPFEVVMAEAEMSEDRLSARLKRIASIDADRQAMLDYMVRQYIVAEAEKDRGEREDSRWKRYTSPSERWPGASSAPSWPTWWPTSSPTASRGGGDDGRV